MGVERKHQTAGGWLSGAAAMERLGGGGPRVGRGVGGGGAGCGGCAAPAGVSAVGCGGPADGASGTEGETEILAWRRRAGRRVVHPARDSLRKRQRPRGTSSPWASSEFFV